MHNVKTPVPARGKGGVATTGTAVAGRGPAGELTMYKEPPSGEVSVEEFEKYALDRLRGKQAQSRYPCKATHGMGSRVCARSHVRSRLSAFHCSGWSSPTVLKAIEEAKLRSKTDEDIQVRHAGSRALCRAFDVCGRISGTGLEVQACVHMTSWSTSIMLAAHSINSGAGCAARFRDCPRVMHPCRDQ
jgi:hypothetical protein